LRILVYRIERSDSTILGNLGILNFGTMYQFKAKMTGSVKVVV